MFPWSSVPMVSMGDLFISSIIIKIIRTSGEIDNDINFNYDANTEVLNSCAATFNGNMYVLGGKFKPKQVYFKYILVFFNIKLF